MTTRVVAIVLVVAALVVVLRLQQEREEPFRVSGFVEADDVRVGSRVGGRVAAVRVREGDRVAKGDVLVELEPHDLLELQAEAEGKVQAREADLRLVETGYRSEEIAAAKARHDQLDARLRELVAGPRPQEIDNGRARVALARANLELAQLEHTRLEGLAANQIASVEQLDRASRDLRVARADLDVRERELALLEEGTRQEQIDGAKAQLAEAAAEWERLRNGYRVEEVQRARAELAAAVAARDAIARRLDELTIRAPLDGVIEALELVPGDLVAAGAPVLSLLDTSALWVRAYVPENRLAVQVGQQVSVTVDSFADRRFRARVTFVSREAEFTPGNVQTPEERSKQVFRIKVTLEEGLDAVRPGMAADVWLDDGDSEDGGAS